MRPLNRLSPYKTAVSRFARASLLTLSFLMSSGHSHAQGAAANASSEGAINSGPVRLRAPANVAPVEERKTPNTPVQPAPEPVKYLAGEFERFVQKQAGSGVEVRRFGADLISGSTDSASLEASPLVPLDYIIAPGDEVLLTVWGGVDADLRLVVDRAGRIYIPRIGAVQVSGVRFGELHAVITRRMSQVFKNFELAVSLGQLRGLRIFVTGFVAQPGSYTVGSLSTVLTALLRAGGPAASGSFRAVELRRAGQLVATLDLYELLLKGDRSADPVVQAGDVVHVGPVGVQVGVLGSVNKPSVIEIKRGEGVADALRFAGGFSAVADRSRLAVERLQERQAARVTQLELPRDLVQTLDHGDVVRAFSAVDIALPTQRQSKRVRIEGEVLRPSEYVLLEGSTLKDVLRLAGGTTPAAYLFATEFSRVSVQLTQQVNYERALRDLETDMARTSTSQRISGSEDATALVARTTATNQLLDRLRQLRPNGRIVLQLQPEAAELPDLALEDGDRILVPARPNTVGVFGSVFNAATYLHDSGRRLADYLLLAGGPTKGADEKSSFVVRANGTVISARLRDPGWFSRSNGLGDVFALPGDTIFVPEELNKTTVVQHLKDWTQILSQFGLGLAAIRILGN